jgi:hypothetical protein
MERNSRGQFVPGIVPFNKKPHLRKVCPACSTVFFVKQSLDRVVHCSRSCARVGKPSGMKGRTASVETRAKMSAAKMGNGGPKHWNYKHGKRAAHGSLALRNWRWLVFERDGFTCLRCGEVGGSLEAHHVKGWAAFPELRFELSNGRTLCVRCHCVEDPFRARFVKAGG